MDNQLSIQNKPQGKQNAQGAVLDPAIVLSLITKNWYIFAISLVISYLIATFYISHTMPVYQSSTTILINETGERSIVNNDDLLQGLGLPGGMRNMENQIMILKSRGLTEKAISELPFETDFYYKTLKNQISIYPTLPIRLIIVSGNPIPRDTEILFKYLGGNEYNIVSEVPYFELNKKVAFGETVEIGGGSFRIERWNEEWLNRNHNTELYFIINSQVNLINYYNSRLEVDLLSRGGSLLEISISGTNKLKDVEFLNKLTEVFKSISLDKKNTEAIRRIQFIDDQLVGISDSLSQTESKLQRFRSSNRVMDVSAQGQAIIGQVTLLENERARLNLEANYYDYLSDYLAKEVSNEIPIVPITMGISDPGLTRLVTELADLQEQLLSRRAGEMNPIQNLLDQKVRSTKAALLETLNGLKRANSLARHENEEQIDRVNKQASALPVTERQLLGIERKFRLNDELYTFLLETRAEQQMQKASNVADSEVIDPADEMFSLLIAPNPIKVYFIGFFSGFGIPALVLILGFILNKRLKEEDIRRMTEIPVVGNIPRSSEKTNTVVFDYPGSSIAEAYRLLRSRMDFFTKEAGVPVILVTSSMPGEGKTYTAINLASVYSLLGKKTVLIGFDLRKPGIYADFNLDNEKGVSTWLIGKDKIQDVIQKTEKENLFVITAGPIPPNPSELTALEKTRDLLNLLKEQFDYIIIDSSPIGFISDTVHLASLSDACLLVVRPRKTLKYMFEVTLREMSINKPKGLCLVVNDLKSENTQYTYGDKFGYTKDLRAPAYKTERKRKLKKNS